jgi:anti-anti-sigma regulatory factor
MLKITRMHESADCVTLQIEGRIGGVWIDELRHECMRCLTQGRTLTLDLSGVQFVEAQGIAMLRGMLDQHIRLVGCSLFLSGLLS